jgi:NAD+ diphosphatase
MVGCFGRASDDQTIRFDLDNELEDAQWFSRSVLAGLVGSKEGSYLSKDDLKKLDDTSTGKAKMEDDRVTANALAPSEDAGRKEVDAESKKGRQGMELTRVPPDTAIAGMLIRTWVNGGVELASTSKL